MGFYFLSKEFQINITYKSLRDKRIFHISHTDVDGLGGVVLSKYYIEPIAKSVEYFITDDRSFEDFDFSYLKNFDACIMTDLTPQVETFPKFIEACPNFIVLDHHATGARQLSEYDNYVCDITKSGTMLLYEWVTQGGRENPVVKEFVTLVDTYDMWKTDDPKFLMAKRLNYAMYGSRRGSGDKLISYTYFLNTQLAKFNSPKERFYFGVSEGDIIRKEEEKERKMYLTGKQNLIKMKDSQGNTFGYTEIRSKISIVASHILKETGLDYLAVYSTYRPKDLKISLRSKGKVDVSKIAEKWKGGGHEQAASFSFDNASDISDLKRGKLSLV